MDEKEIIERQLFSDTSRYDDIMDLPVHRSKAHLPMSQEDRAGQFSPFAALTGFNSLIRDTAEIYAHKKYLSAKAEAQVRQQLVYAQKTQLSVIIHYFNDQSGYYEEFQDRITNLKWERGRVFFAEHPSIAIANVESIRRNKIQKADEH